MERKHTLHFVAHHSGVDSSGEMYANTGRRNLIPIELCTLDSVHAQ